jgi:hypothetical protein
MILSFDRLSVCRRGERATQTIRAIHISAIEMLKDKGLRSFLKHKPFKQPPFTLASTDDT